MFEKLHWVINFLYFLNLQIAQTPIIWIPPVMFELEMEPMANLVTELRVMQKVLFKFLIYLK